MASQKPKHVSTSTRILQTLNRPVDAASLVLFRVAFGAMMAGWAWDYLSTDRVGHMYVTPRFHFTYYLFDWVQPWHGQGMYVHFFILCLLACAISAGCFYRLASSLFALGFVYVFLLDRTNYQNHYYLIALIAAWLPFLPLNRYFSIDAWRCDWDEAWVMPNWVLQVIRFHIGLPYFFGGISKLDADWLLGFPMQQMLESKQNMPLIGPIISAPGMGIAFAWSGLLLDLLVVPLLIWKPTRAWAYVAALCFHLMNSALFEIHVFPWFMIVATTVFFAPDWPRRLLSREALRESLSLGDIKPEVAWFGSMSLSLRWILVVYCLFHSLWPLRHLAYGASASWTEQGHHFAWRMMLRGKKVVLGYAVKDEVTGQVHNGDAKQYLNPEQAEKFGKDPEMILHMAHHMAAQFKSQTGHPVAVYALVFTSLNGRKPELMIDPNVDLSKEPRGWHQRRWIMPQTAPLQMPAWDLPPEQWKQHLEMPKLDFLKPQSDK